MVKIYVASSWHNRYQPDVVMALVKLGHEVYDFRNPTRGNKGFHWDEIDKYWRDWTHAEYEEALKHPIAEEGFKLDFDAMRWADACVLVLPCNRSSHLEAGWFIGQGKPTFIYSPEKEEPKLMYKMATTITPDLYLLEKELSKLDV
jgi:hypothetical protein